VALGPEGLGLVQPRSLGPALQVLVGFAVAVILFEGALHLNVRRLRQEARPIQRLVTLGALVTAVGGALATRLLLGWEWRVCILFGTLVMVTGPTVINPLLRRIGVTRSLHVVLEAEGIFVDAVGAIVAVVALEVALQPAGEWLAHGVPALLSRWGVGLAVGAVGGALTVLALRSPRLLPEGLESVFTLSFVLLLFQAANALKPESGIIAVIAAGLVVGNWRVPAEREVRAFKEQLTTLLIGLLFVLLAADVRLSQVAALGWPGVAVVLVLMLLVRPLAVALSTTGSRLSLRERAFVAWLAPRGIVAAAVASLFAGRMQEAGVEGGEPLRALVFLVIAVTVVVQGLSGGWVARLLRVRRQPSGYVVAGANGLARLFARALQECGEEVVLVDVNDEACRRAEAEGLKVVYGSALDERTLRRCEPQPRRGFVGLTPNESVNLLFARRVREEVRRAPVWVAIHRAKVSVNTGNVAEGGAAILFGQPRHLDGWAQRAERGEVPCERWRREEVQGEEGARATDFPRSLLPLLRTGRGGGPVDGATRFLPGEELVVALDAAHAEEGRAWLAAHGWHPLEARPGPPAQAEASESPGLLH
jgi:NhaP-type Na+/H+ or K+/H+ antiporter